MKDLHDIIDFDDLDAGERERLERVHALLLQAGPPPELSPALARPEAPPEPARVLQFPKRRQRVLLLAAATIAAAAFGGGYLAGHPATFTAERVVDMHAPNGGSALAVLKIAKRDEGGNWPMRISISGLPQQTQRTAYYELWLTRDGRPSKSCGTFRVYGKTTTVNLSVPYSFKGISGWVVTAHKPGETDTGNVVLTT